MTNIVFMPLPHSRGVFTNPLTDPAQLLGPTATRARAMFCTRAGEADASPSTCAVTQAAMKYVAGSESSFACSTGVTMTVEMTRQ